MQAIERSVLNFWGVLGEIGGLYSVLFGTIALTSFIINYKSNENYMTAQLYAQKERGKSKPIDFDS